MTEPVYFAHSSDQDTREWQLLRCHLAHTAQLASDMGADPGVSAYAAVAALLHDIGKYSQAFQRRLSGASIRVDHSTAGAQEIVRLLAGSSQRLVGTILAYCIAGHHGGLPDYGSPVEVASDSTLRARLKRAVEDYSAYSTEIDLAGLSLPPYLPVRPIPRLSGFSVAFFTRMVYSALVDADFLDTETFMHGDRKPRGGYAGIPALAATFNRFLEAFGNPQEPINQQRTETLNACLARAADPPGLFSLTVPTGGGKTFASLAFALNHAIAHGLKRIVYVIPYTSIIEQNAAEFKRVLGLDNVLEHHSNFDWESLHRPSDPAEADEQTDSILGKLRLAAENWDVPIVVTTNVQLFESLYADRSSRCRKLHNLAKAVLIFDETQMLPRDYIRPCLLAVYELARNYGASAVFCTATQPIVQRFLPAGADVVELAPDPRALYRFYKRVQVQDAGKLADEELAGRMNAQPQALCIVNTRRHAKGLFGGLNEDGRFHLSTLMCAAHRKAVIAKIRVRLKAGLPCRVVSTQIMEAGMDVDFPVGYRAMSGLDSIIQAAGRVNRENRRARGELFVFEPDSEFVGRTPAYIAQGAEVSRTILRRYQDRDPVCIEAIEAYYRSLYDLQDPSAFDRKAILDCFEKRGVDDAVFDFRTAAERFKLIENNTVAVVIRWGERADGLLEQVRAGRPVWQLSRELQLYTVNIYEHEYRALSGLGLIDVYDEVLSVLNCKEHYDEETGLCIPQTRSGEAVFFDG